MSNVFITPADLAPFATIAAEKAQAMIDDAYARAARVAPCLKDSEFQADADNVAAVRSVLRAAVLRRNDAGTGVTQYQTTGPYSVATDTKQPHRSLLWPSEIEELQNICRAFSGDTPSPAFSVTPTGGTGLHAPFCDLMFGGTTCSCGANLTNYQYPLYEA